MKKQTTLEFAGELTIRDLQSPRERLVAAMRAGSDVTVSIAEDSAVDLSLVQLLLSARRSATEAGLGFALAEPAHGALLETLRRGGLVGTPDQAAFWLQTSGEI